MSIKNQKSKMISCLYDVVVNDLLAPVLGSGVNYLKSQCYIDALFFALQNSAPLLYHPPMEISLITKIVVLLTFLVAVALYLFMYR